MRRRYRGRFTKFESWFKEEHGKLTDTELAAYFFLKHIADDEGRFEPRTKMLDAVCPLRFRGKWTDFLKKYKSTGHIVVYRMGDIIISQIAEWQIDQDTIRTPTPSILPAHPDFDTQEPLFGKEIEIGTKIPYMEVIKLWNNICHGKKQVLPSVHPSAAKKPHEDPRLKQLACQWKHEKGNLLFWERLFRRVIKSDYLTGKIPPRNSPTPFSASFGWVVDPRWTRSILEGNYDNKVFKKRELEDAQIREIEHKLREDERQKTMDTKRLLTGLDRGIKESLEFMALEELKKDYKEEHITVQFIEVRMAEIWYRTHDREE